MAPTWYSRWEGSQRIDDLDADQLLDAMSDDLLSDGDPWSAPRSLPRGTAPASPSRRARWSALDRRFS